jgi:hypothetical protein
VEILSIEQCATYPYTTIVLQLTLTSNLGSSLQKADFFILDPRFPNRLNTSGYTKTIKFVQSLFTEYAQAGLSKESDREIAISGLLQRMDHAFKSEHRYGIFECFISRLLLWRVSGNGNGNGVNGGAVDRSLPSWSWMTHNRIEFFPEGKIKILRGSIKFGSGAKLVAPIRRLQNCKIKQRGNSYVIQDRNSHDVGELWFDGQASTTVKDCVVVGMQDLSDLSQDPNGCFFLLLSTYDNHYQRIGAGHIEARCLSKDYWKGAIV